jgi:hypothetical protein
MSIHIAWNLLYNNDKFIAIIDEACPKLQFLGKPPMIGFYNV